MEYVLLGVLVLGIVLFLLGWLVMVVICFQRHPVTGLVAMLPGINILALPATWHRVSGWVITGFIGVLLAGVAWFAGANQHVYRYAHTLGMNTAVPAQATVAAPAATPEAVPPPVTHTIEIPPEARATPAAAPPPAAQPAVAPEPVPVAPQPPTPEELLAGTKDLPANALYHVVFESMAVSKLSGSEGKYVRITQKDGHRREGKVNAASASEIGLEERLEGGTVTRSIKTDDIREAFIMTRKQGQE